MEDNALFDVIVIGGSYAGLSAAMSLGRALRNILVIDSGQPCNKQTPHSHNFLTQDGMPPAEIAARAKQQVLAYDTVTFYEDIAIQAAQTDSGFVLQTQGGKTVRGKKLIFATGIKDLLPDIEGMDACWGISVIHCPYCHGYEFREKKTGILANGDHAFHVTPLVNNLTDKITILTSGKATFTPAQSERLTRHAIPIIEKEIVKIIHEKGQLEAVVFKDGQTLALDCLYAAVPFKQQSDLPAALGCALTDKGHLTVNPMQKTTIEGVYACGDNVSMMRSVATAVASGNFTGAAVNAELTQEGF